MSNSLTFAAGAATVYVPPGRTEALAEALATTIAGQPLPEALRAPAPPLPRFANSRDALAWILGGPSR